jgi:hypothetical protein
MTLPLRQYLTGENETNFPINLARVALQCKKLLKNVQTFHVRNV